jgi:hypothetical protein
MLLGEKKQKTPCANGQAPLKGYFCGRGANRQDCPSTHECVIAPNDAYVVCCPLSQQDVTTATNLVGKSGSCPKPSESIDICIARCTDNSDYEGDLKCCGGCPCDCVKPVL